jgi:uncharacterized protein
MSKETIEKIVENLYHDLNHDDEITIAFQGGEPTLAGLEWFEYFTTTMNARRNSVKINYAFQTNGIIIDDAWVSFLAKNKFLTGLSIDAVKNLHNTNRKDAAGNETWERCLVAKKTLEKYGAAYNILCVLTNSLAAHPDRVWQFIMQENIKYIQFIPCLEGLEETEYFPYVLRPALFTSFYAVLYSWWAKELGNGNYVSVKLFDDTVNYFFYGIRSSCGIDGICRSQFVVESDGSVYPCDFYVLDRYRIGNLSKQTLREIFDNKVMQEFLHEDRALSTICKYCKYRNQCGGGCKRMKNTVYFGKSGSFCGYKNFLDKCLKPLEHTVRRYFG